MATFSSFSGSATLNFAATESFTNGPIICFNGTVTATSSLSASNGGNYVVWGASNSGLTGYNYLTLVNQTLTGSSLSTFIEISKQLAGVDFGADCEAIIDTYISGQNLYDLFESHYIILSQSFLYPTLIVSPATQSFGDVYSNASSIQTFTVQGFNLLADLTINSTNPSKFRISTDSVTFTNTLTLYPVDGVINLTTLYTQFDPTLVLGGFSGSIEFTSSVASASIFATGSGIQEPVISVDTTGFNASYGNVLINTSSSQQEFVVDGNYLVDDIIITAGEGFLVSLTSGSGYTGSCVLTQSAGVVTAVPVYSVFYPTASGEYVNTIDANSTYATEISTLVQGYAFNPSLYVDPLIIDFGAVPSGGQSSQFEIVVSGSSLISDVIITSSIELLISTTSGSGYTSGSITLTPTPPLGDLAATTIYTILEPVTIPPGDYTGSIVFTTTSSAITVDTTGSIT